MHFYLEVFVRKAVNTVDFEVVLTWRGKIIIFKWKILNFVRKLII